MKNLIYILLAMIVVLTSCGKNEENSTDVFTVVYSRDNIMKQTFSISGEEDTILIGKSGTTLRISKNTFVDENGQIISGSVDVELKEVFTPLDMVLGNLTTTSNGKILQSGGMVYVDATSNGKKLFIADSSSINVSVPTEKRIDDMKIFSAEIDPLSKKINWINPKEDIENESNDISDSSQVNTKLLDDTPKKPEKVKPADNRIITIAFDNPEMFPELEQYQNVKFRVNDNCKFNSEDSKRSWYSVDLQKTKKEGIYAVSFKGYDDKGLIERTYQVSPVFEGGDYTLALADYEKKYELYEKKKKEIADKRAEEKKKEVVIEALDEAKSYIFNINKLGWSNVDRFYNDSRAQPVEFLTRIENQNEFSNIYVSLIMTNQSIYISGQKKTDKSYSFTYGEDNKIILPVGESATIIATAYKNNLPYFTCQKITIARNQNISLHLNETTIKDLKKELQENI